MRASSIPKLLAAAAVAAGLLGAIPAEAAKDSPCRPSCRATIRVGSQPVQWTSRASFPDEAPVEVTLKVGKRELDAELIRSCAANYYGRGVVAKVEGCDRPSSRIRVRAVNVEPKPVKLKIIVRAQ